MRKLVIGDIHGNYKALLQCFDRSKFNYEQDKLIAIGDVCDGWAQVKECINELLKIKNLVFLLGNHDQWALNWMVNNVKPMIWLSQGGKNTMASYGFSNKNVPKSHIEFLRWAPCWFEENGKLFIHGGLYNPKVAVQQQDINEILWDRTLITKAMTKQALANATNKIPKNLTQYKEVFIGHTTTLHFKTIEPIHACEIWDLDTGAGWNGKLTIMNIDTKEYWQSDFAKELYPNTKGRWEN